MIKLSDALEDHIEDAILEFDGNYRPDNDIFEEILTLSELVDKLCITNLKIAKIKDVQQTSKDIEVLADCSRSDVQLCKLRSRLKNAIDEKVVAMIARNRRGDVTCGVNFEVKKYGN